MSDEVKLNIRPVEVNPAVDGRSDTAYVFQVADELGGKIDLGGYSARMQLRPHPRSKRVYDELTTENGRISVAGDQITVRFPASVTANFKFDRAVFDLIIISASGMQYRIVQGLIEFSPGVTE